MKLYLTDLDGTLLDHKAQIGRMTEALMNRLIDDDIKISYATARSVHSAEPKVSCIKFLSRFPIWISCFHCNHHFDTRKRLHGRL